MTKDSNMSRTCLQMAAHNRQFRLENIALLQLSAEPHFLNVEKLQQQTDSSKEPLSFLGFNLYNKSINRKLLKFLIKHTNLQCPPSLTNNQSLPSTSQRRSASINSMKLTRLVYPDVFLQLENNSNGALEHYKTS